MGSTCLEVLKVRFLQNLTNAAILFSYRVESIPVHESSFYLSCPDGARLHPEGFREAD